jgi:hypothetical protein
MEHKELPRKNRRDDQTPGGYTWGSVVSNQAVLPVTCTANESRETSVAVSGSGMWR